MLASLQSVLCFLGSCLKKGVMLAHLKEDGNFEKFTESLN